MDKSLLFLIIKIININYMKNIIHIHLIIIRIKYFYFLF